VEDAYEILTRDSHPRVIDRAPLTKEERFTATELFGDFDFKGENALNKDALLSILDGRGGVMMRHLTADDQGLCGTSEWYAFFSFVKEKRGRAAMEHYMSVLKTVAVEVREEY